ncbi:MAG: adenylate kinase [Chloroflexi bacterium]|nr:MAG: adenylate kinase [Chloroflexota bacterium]
MGGPAHRPYLKRIRRQEVGRYIVLLGAPGAGKGTQAGILSQEMGIPHVATGDLFRYHLKEGTELGKLAKAYMERGDLVPDEVTVGMVRERLGQPDCAQGVILDGFPRTIAQAEALDALLAERGERVTIVPYIKVSEEVLLQRLGGRWTCRQCGRVYHTLFDPPPEPGRCACGGELYQRPDDTPETQRRRIEVYMEQTSPLITYYRERGLLVEIDGEQDIDAVHEALAAAIETASVQQNP